MEPIQILDVIYHRNKYFTKRFLVLDRMPIFTFIRRGDFLIAEDCGFFKFYKYGACGPTWKAFAGAKFDIPMSDGTKIEAYGQWWSATPQDYADLTYEPGINTVAELSRCHVFRGGCVDRVMVDSWVAVNEPSNNYHKYDPRHADFGKHTIVSPWEPVSEPASVS